MLTGCEENDDLHGHVFVVVHAQTPKLVCKAGHARHEAACAGRRRRSGGGGGGHRRGHALRGIRVQLEARREAHDAVGTADGAEAAGEDQQLTPTVDQESNLIVDLRREKKAINYNYKSY